MTVTSTSKIRLNSVTHITFAKYAAARVPADSVSNVPSPSQVSSLYCGSGDTNKGDGTGWETPMNTQTVT